MYGSCATKLDLPSSDLDVAICGLDREEEGCNLPKKGRNQQTSECNSKVYGTDTGAINEDESPNLPASRSESISSSLHCNPYQSQYHFYPALSKNGQRVLRLAHELEIQPWAVQVKAIPTASVPVIKILVDPSKLPGATGAMD